MSGHEKSYDRYMQGTYDRDVPRLDIYKAGLSHYCNHISLKPWFDSQSSAVTLTMVLINESHHDVVTSGGTTMRIFLFHPVISGYPNAKFPGVVVFSEIYQGITGYVIGFLHW